MKASIERLVRENNLELDTRFKSKLDNLKDQNEIDMENIKKTEGEQQKQITLVQQKLYDISDYKLKEAIDTSNEAQAKVDELRVKMQDIIFRNSNGEGERIDQLLERINTLQAQVEDLSKT